MNDDYIWKNNTHFPATCFQCHRTETVDDDMSFWKSLDGHTYCANCNCELLLEQVRCLQEDNTEIHRQAADRIQQAIVFEKQLNETIDELTEELRKLKEK